MRPDWVIGRADDTWLAVSETASYVLPPALAALVSRVDGARSVEDLVANRPEGMSDFEATLELTELVQRGVLLRDDPSNVWSGIADDPRVASELLAQRPLSVTAVGDTDAGGLVESLEELGAWIVEDAPTVVLVSEDYLSTAMHDAQASARAANRGTIAVRVRGVEPWVGPHVLTESGPCWACLLNRLRANHPVEELLRRRGTAVRIPRATPERTRAAAEAWAAIEIVQSISAPSGGRLVGALARMSWKTGLADRHIVVRRPQCAGCGDPAHMAAVGERSVRIDSVPRIHTDGGYRRASAEDSHARLAHHVSPITGAVTYLEPMTSRHTRTRAVFASGYRVCPRTMNAPRPFDKSCAGKGQTAEQARMSALAEALERYAGVYQGDEARTRSTQAALGDSALAPADIAHFSGAQHARDLHSNPAYGSRPAQRARSHDPRTFVPWLLDPETPIDWAPAWSLTHGRRRYVPFGHCWAEPPDDSGVEYVSSCGNGVAAGSCVEEAVLQALLELVERDAVATWWYNRVHRPLVPLDPAVDPYWRSLVTEYQGLGFDLWVLDLTHDLDIPVCAAIGWSRAENRYVMGFGCHLSPILAVHRALTELNQVFEPGAKPPAWQPPSEDADFLRPNADAAGRMPESGTADDGDLAQDVGRVLGALQRAGMECLVVDKTRPDVGLSVVQVIVPALRHFWPRFAPGRLYDVPVALGWRREPATETSLNPISLFL